MNNSLRNGARIVVVAALTVGVVPFAGSVRADAIRTDTNLAGYSITAQAAPLMVLVDDPKAAIPRPTGTAVVEGDPNFTLASVSTGPNADAIASTVWPGNLFGEGLPAIDPRIPPYPLKAESRYPDKPYTAQGVDGGALTNSSALGLDAFAQADGTPTNKPGQVTVVGGLTSTSAADVTDKDVATGKAVSAVHDVNVLGGIIHVGSVTTRLNVTADGTKPTASGTTTVTGLTIAGQTFAVDDKGVHAGPQNSTLPPLTSPSQLQSALGISIEGLLQKSTTSGDSATSTASGLVIRIDTAVLKAQLKPVIGPIKPIYNMLVDKYIPPQAQSNFYYLINATPSLTFVFGAGTTTAAATLPIHFQFPPPPVFGGGPVLGSGGGVPTTGVTGPGPALGLPPPPGTGPTTIPPVVPTPTGTIQAATVHDARFGGIPSIWVIAALAGSGLIGWGLLRFLGLAGGLIGFGCRLGAPTSVPDLRSVTA